MQKVLGLIILMVFGPLASLEASTYRKIVTMNIHCYQDNWDFRVQQILNYFISTNQDVIALQEVCTDPSQNHSQIDYIFRYLSNHGYPIRSFEAQYTHPAWNQYDEYLLVISKHPNQSVDKGFLPQSPLQRGYIGLFIEGRWYINIHLEYRHDQANFRRQQLDFLKTHFHDSPHIIMGDFNSHPEAPEQTGIRDSGYWAAFPGPSHIGHDGNNSDRIDGFWISPALQPQLEHHISRIVLDQKVNGQYLSDHFAVLLEAFFR
jgi:endonuclease/exonuclease/phosphatase family metal-dependent hydrolase